MASQKVSLELDVGNFDLDTAKMFRSGQTIDFVNGIAKVEVVSEAIKPVLAVVSKGKRFFVGRVEAQLERNFYVPSFNQVTVQVHVTNLADSCAVWHILRFSQFEVKCFEFNWVVRLVERLNTVGKTLLKEVPGVRLKETVLNKQVLRLDSIDEEFEGG